MNIGYRRYSGPVWLDATKVKSKRGAWLEKRTALFRRLTERGNTLTIIKNGDDYSQFDKILVEFGSLNYMFHRHDIDFSNEILKSGKAIFILDDPDLMPKDIFGAPVWVNAEAEACQKKWHVPCETFPVYALQDMKPSKPHNRGVVYYGGTSGGREKLLVKYMVLIPELEIYGDQKDYKHMKPKEPPTQSERADFYSNFMACLNVTDGVHKKLKWNTGRKFHAIMAGCPVVEEDVMMKGTVELLLKDPTYRSILIKEQQDAVQWAKLECDKLFTKYGF